MEKLGRLVVVDLGREGFLGLGHQRHLSRAEMLTLPLLGEVVPHSLNRGDESTGLPLRLGLTLIGCVSPPRPVGAGRPVG